MKFKYILNVYVYDEYNEGPEKAEIIFTPELIKRIQELHKAVKSVKASKISDYDCTPNWLNKDPDNEGQYVEWDEGDGGIDCLTLNVTDDVEWSGWIKHTSILVETESIRISELLEIKKVFTTPKIKLPLLIHELKSDKAKEALEQRFKGKVEK